MTTANTGSGASLPMSMRQPLMPRSMAGHHNPWLIAVVVSLTTFMEVLDITIVNVSLQHIAGYLAASYSESTWVLTSYLVSNAIILPISGWLSNVMGRKQFYLTCVGLFTASSFLCGIAPSLTWLIVFRVLQGAGGGGLTPSSLAILRDSFPEEKTGMVYALYGVVVVAAPALGPSLGGYITDHYSWHWVFLINVPVGIFALWLCWALLVEPAIETRERRQRWARGLKIDYWGFIFVAVGLGTLQVVLDKGQEEDWFASRLILVMSVIAGLALIALVIREFIAEDPVVDLPLLKDRNFLAVNVIRLILFAILLGTTQLIPQLVQTSLGYTAELAGLVITPGAFVIIAIMPIMGWLVNRVQPRYLIGVGMLVLAAAMYTMSNFTTTMGFWTVAWARCFQGAGIALMMVPITTVAFIGMPADKTGHASALINVTRNVGGAFGISLAQTWLARRSQFHQSRLVEHITPYSESFRQGLDQLHPLVHDQGTATEQFHHTLGIIYQMIQQQALMMSYDDIFLIMAITTLILTPLIFLLKAVKPGQETPQGH